MLLKTTVAVVSIAALNVMWLFAQSNAPSQLEFSTYLGGSAADAVTAIRVASSGDIYVAGSTRSTDLAMTGSLFPPPPPNATVGFLVRLRADRTIVYSTYLPRPVVALAVDTAGNAIVADQLAAFSKFTGSTDDVAISKIDPSGSTVIYSVRLGGNRLDRVKAIAVDAAGAVVVTGQTGSTDFPLLNPLQTTVLALFSTFGNGGSAFITKLDTGGRIVFSTVWGGSGESVANAVAIDGNFDIIISGTTASTDFVTTDRAFQRRLANTICTTNAVPCRDAFVTKLSPDGQTIRYSTLFGGSNGETVHALAVDRFGSPHIAGITASSDLPLERARQTSCDSLRTLVNGCSTFVTKLSPDGSTLQYSTYFGSLSYYVYGPGQVINALSIDPAGNLVAAGTTQGNDLPLAGAFQSVNGAGPLFKSTDDGATWVPSSYGISGTGVWHLASGGSRSPLYASALGGQVFRSSDHGESWRGRRGAPDFGSNFAVDSLTPSTLYAISGNQVMKSMDAGERWLPLSLDERELIAVAVAPSSPSNVYVAARRGVFHSRDGGVTWSLVLDTHVESLPVPYVQALAIHPHDAGAVYAMVSDRRILRRLGGNQWAPLASLECPANQMVFSVGSPSSIYARSCGKVWRSDNDGGSWRAVGAPDRTAAWMAVDPARSNVLYFASAQNGVYRSIDRGETWTQIRQPLDQDVRAILVDPSVPGTIYIGATAASNAFVTRFDPAGAVMFSSYLGGLNAEGAVVAVDREGSMIVGGTAGRDFSLVQPLQTQYGGAVDAFFARIVVR